METFAIKDLKDCDKEIMNNTLYGREFKLIEDCLNAYPNNNDIKIVAMKIGLIDITNSTHISQHKGRISVDELTNHIINIKDIDKRLRSGDPCLVNEIASPNKNINLFSFASKYCFYHNFCVYKKDDYSIYDTILQKNLPNYFDDVTSYAIEKWRNNKDYKKYNDYITNKLDELGIIDGCRKHLLDHYIWFKNREETSKKVNSKDNINPKPEMAAEALKKLGEESIKNETSNMTLEEINAEIDAARKNK